MPYDLMPHAECPMPYVLCPMLNSTAMCHGVMVPWSNTGIIWSHMPLCSCDNGRSVYHLSAYLISESLNHPAYSSTQPTESTAYCLLLTGLLSATDLRPTVLWFWFQRQLKQKTPIEKLICI